MELLIDILLPYGLWIKALHIISVVAWMAGLFYLPRLFVYHAAELANFKDSKSPTVILLRIMELRLYRILMIPSMIFSLASGIILVIVQHTWSAGWLHLKLLGVLGLVIFHHTLNYWRKSLAKGTCHHSNKFFRMMNEIPTLLLVIIVICVVIKPF